MSNAAFASLSLDASGLSKSSINTIRVALGISAGAALIIGILITLWPKTAVVAMTVLLGIYLLIAGLAYLGLATFARGISGRARALHLILGLLFVGGDILAFVNVDGSAVDESAVFLAAFLGVLIGVLWIVHSVIAIAHLGDFPSMGWAIFASILYIIAGIILLLSPLWGAVVQFIITGIALIVLGILQGARALTFGRGVTAAA